MDGKDFSAGTLVVNTNIHWNTHVKQVVWGEYECISASLWSPGMHLYMLLWTGSTPHLLLEHMGWGERETWLDRIPLWLGKRGLGSGTLTSPHHTLCSAHISRALTTSLFFSKYRNIRAVIVKPHSMLNKRLEYFIEQGIQHRKHGWSKLPSLRPRLRELVNGISQTAISGSIEWNIQWKSHEHHLFTRPSKIYIWSPRTKKV